MKARDMVKIKGSWLVTGETSFDDDVSDAGTVAYCIKEDLEDAGGFGVDEVVPFDIQSRARNAAEEIMDKVFVPGETVTIERLVELIARNFSDGEE